MNHRKFSCSPWARYSKKLIAAIEKPQHAGVLTQQQANTKGMRLISLSFGDTREGAAFTLYLLVDESDGVIADAKFQVVGPSALIGALETACKLLVRKPSAFLMRLTADMIDTALRTSQEESAFPEETLPYLNATIDALEEASLQCQDLMKAPPTPVQTQQEETSLYPGWEYLPKEEQLRVIEEVIASDIRPYIELDAGGIEILDLIDGKELKIAYQGACTTCYSSTGATLSAIQGILQKKIHPSLSVIPQL